MVAVTRRFLIDLTPLRASPDFRRLFTGQVISMIGSQLTVVAIAFQVYSLTRSSLQVGAVSLAQLVPFVAGTLAGGAISDAVDRRWVLVVTSSLLALASGGLAVNALGPHASVLTIYLVTAVAAGLSGVVATAATATVPSLVTADQLTPAYATMQVIDQVGLVVGPALSGLLIAALGLPWLFGIDALTFLWTAWFMWRMAAVVTVVPTRRPGVRSVLEGLGYLRGRQELQGTYLVDLCATVFGLPRALFPALARTVFHEGPDVLGILYAAPAAGALAGSLTSGWVNSVRRQGRAVLIAVLTWGSDHRGLRVHTGALGDLHPAGRRRVGGRDLCCTAQHDRPNCGQRTLSWPDLRRADGRRRGRPATRRPGGWDCGGGGLDAVLYRLRGCRLCDRCASRGPTPAGLPPVQSTSRLT
jgi:MFS family permease